MDEIVTVGGFELEEGMTIWRLDAVNIFKTFSEQDPEDALHETASQLVRAYPEAVDHASVEEVQQNLRESPGYYDDTDLMRYQAMRVESVSPDNWEGAKQVEILDQKERKTFMFTDPDEHLEGETRRTWESLEALEKHLGTTLLPVPDDE